MSEFCSARSKEESCNIPPAVRRYQQCIKKMQTAPDYREFNQQRCEQSGPCRPSTFKTFDPIDEGQRFFKVMYDDWVANVPYLSIAFGCALFFTFTKTLPVWWNSSNDICLCYNKIVSGEILRIPFSSFEHKDALHLLVNLISFAFKGPYLERRYGRPKLLILLMTLPFFVNMLQLFLLRATTLISSSPRLQQCFMGYTGPLMVLKVLVTKVVLLECPFKTPVFYMAWLELIFIQMMSSGVTLLAMISGLIIGIMYWQETFIKRFYIKYCHGKYVNWAKGSEKIKIPKKKSRKHADKMLTMKKSVENINMYKNGELIGVQKNISRVRSYGPQVKCCSNFQPGELCPDPPLTTSDSVSCSCSDLEAVKDLPRKKKGTSSIMPPRPSSDEC